LLPKEKFYGICLQSLENNLGAVNESRFYPTNSCNILQDGIDSGVESCKKKLREIYLHSLDMGLKTALGRNSTGCNFYIND
jgi:hypothetical protein